MSGSNTREVLPVHTHIGGAFFWREVVERMVGSQPPPACCHASHILFHYIEDYSRGALGE